MKERDAEMARLKKELKEARMETEILKKAVAIPSAGSGQASRGASGEIPVH